MSEVDDVREIPHSVSGQHSAEVLDQIVDRSVGHVDAFGSYIFAGENVGYFLQILVNLDSLPSESVLYFCTEKRR